MKNSLVTKESITFMFILGMLVLISTSILTYMNSRDQIENKNTITEAYTTIAILEKTQSVISDLDNLSNESTASKDKKSLINDNGKYLDSLLKQLSSSSINFPLLQDNIDTLKILVNQRLQLLNDEIKLREKTGANPKIYRTILEKERILQSDIRTIINRMKNDELSNLSSKNEMSEKSYRFTFFTFIAGITISCIIFIAVFILLKKKAQEIFSSEPNEITREELEQIVRERTAEISQINQKLYQKIGLLEKMEGALKRSEQYYKMLFEQAHDAIIIFSPDDEKVLDLNSHACEIYGFTREEFIGLSLKSMSKNIPYTQEHIKLTLKKGYYHNFQSVHYKKDSTEMLIEVNASVISYNGKPAILSINRDITDRILKVF